MGRRVLEGFFFGANSHLDAFDVHCPQLGVVWWKSTSDGSEPTVGSGVAIDWQSI